MSVLTSRPCYHGPDAHWALFDDRHAEYLISVNSWQIMALAALVIGNANNKNRRGLKRYCFDDQAVLQALCEDAEE